MLKVFFLLLPLLISQFLVAAEAYYPYETKITLAVVGESHVGKTGIVSRFVHDKFNIADSGCTIGCDLQHKRLTIKTKDNKDQRLLVYLWDVAGNPRFTPTENLFRNVKGIVLVYDITDEKSFAKLEDWITMLNKLVGDISNFSVLLLGNKSDLDWKRKIAKQEGRNYAKKKGFSFAETSAYRGNGVRSALKGLVKEIACSETAKEDGKMSSDSSLSLSYELLFSQQVQQPKRSRCCK